MLTHSPTLHAAQSRGFDQTLAKARKRLAELQARLARGKTRRGRDAVEADIAAIVKPRWVSRGPDHHPDRREPRRPATHLHSRPAGTRNGWKHRLFGKRILFTNRATWTTGDVVAAYRSQSEVEAGFRQQKDPHVVSFGPMHHWTDQKIRVHVFYSVLALTIAHLMRRQADQPACACPSANCSTSWPASKKPCCSTTTAAKDVPAPNACSPTRPHPATTRRPLRHQPLPTHPLTSTNNNGG